MKFDFEHFTKTINEKAIELPEDKIDQVGYVFKIAYKETPLHAINFDSFSVEDTYKAIQRYTDGQAYPGEDDDGTEEVIFTHEHYFCVNEAIDTVLLSLAAAPKVRPTSKFKFI